jgi:cbb3-type cytochrome oxidase subunit 3
VDINKVKIKLSKGQIFTVSAILIALTSVSYQLYLLRKQNKKEEMGEAYFVYPED